MPMHYTRLFWANRRFMNLSVCDHKNLEPLWALYVSCMFVANIITVINIEHRQDIHRSDRKEKKQTT